MTRANGGPLTSMNLSFERRTWPVVWRQLKLDKREGSYVESRAEVWEGTNSTEGADKLFGRTFVREVLRENRRPGRNRLL